MTVSLVSGQACSGRTAAQCAGDCQWNGAACSEICFRSNTAYTADMSGQAVTTLGSQELCKQRCQNVPGCAHFTFYAATGSCHLQDNTASRQAATGAVSGEPGCVQAATGATSLAVGAGSTAVGAGSTGAGAGSTAASAGSAAVGAGSAAPGSAESMPTDVGSAMVVGSANAGGSFSGLSSETPSLFSSVSGISWGVIAAWGFAFVAALTMAKLRRPSVGMAAETAE